MNFCPLPSAYQPELQPYLTRDCYLSLHYLKSSPRTRPASGSGRREPVSCECLLVMTLDCVYKKCHGQKCVCAQGQGIAAIRFQFALFKNS